MSYMEDPECDQEPEKRLSLLNDNPLEPSPSSKKSFHGVFNSLAYPQNDNVVIIYSTLSFQSLIF